MKRRYTSLLLAAVIAITGFTFSACGKDEEQKNNNDIIISETLTDTETADKSEESSLLSSEKNGTATSRVKTSSGASDKDSSGIKKNSHTDSGSSKASSKAGGNASGANSSKAKSPTKNTSSQNKPGSDTNSPASENVGSDIENNTPQNITAAYPSSAGFLKVKGTHLTSEAGDIVQLKGVSTHGIAWYPQYINSECFSQLKNDWGANVVRLAMYTEEYGGYCAGGDTARLKSLIRSGVSYAVENDMYVIIDWHILSDGNPLTHKNEAVSFFSEMSAEFADCPNVIYEICNEPNNGTTWQQIKTYAEEIIRTIRSNASQSVILVGTPNWSQYVDEAAAEPIKGYSNIMYTLHFYAATHTDGLRSTLNSAVKSGLPVFVSEFGICDASGTGAIDEHQANMWIDTLNSYGISFVAWNLSNKDETSALLKSSCSKTSGFTLDDLSASGRWLYETLNNCVIIDGEGDDFNQNTGDTGGGQSDNSENSPQSEKVTDGSIEYSVQKQESWESGGEKFCKYEVTLYNQTSSDCSSWSIELLFNGDIELSDGWNGNYTVSGNSLQITSKDYNGFIASGGSIGNIGFIVKGGGELQ